MKKSSARLSFLACIFIVAALFILSQPTMSLSSGANINVVFEFEKVLQLSVSDTEMLIENLVPGTTDNTNEIMVNVATNSETGFIMDAAVGERLRPSTRIPSLRNSNAYFSSVGLNTTVSVLPAGSWGYSTDHGATFSGLPDYRDVHPSDVFLESHTAANLSLPFLVGASAAEDQDRGIYYTPITFRAVVRPTVPTIDTILYMQELDETVYESMKTEKQYQLMDKRDGKMYFVSKLKDGNVWMTQNLDFELHDGITLNPETSDVLEEKTMDLTPLGQNQSRSTHYYYYDNYQYDPGEYYCNLGFCYNNTYLTPLDTLEPTDEENHYALGNYYSWAAATANYFEQCPKYNIDNAGYNRCRSEYSSAGVRDSETSICPAGWTLPSAFYGNKTSTSDLGFAIGLSSYYSSMDYPIFAKPLYMAGSGYLYAYESGYSNYLFNGNAYAYSWTSTASNSDYAFYHYVYSYTTSRQDSTTGAYIYYPYSGYFTSYQNTNSMYNLYTIRCVARAPQYTVELYRNDGQSSTPYDTWKSKEAWSGNNEYTPSSPERAGYKFLGWGTSPQTVEARYPANTKIRLEQHETKLYAVWELLDDSDMEEGVHSFAAVLRRAGATSTDGYYNLQDLTAEMCNEVTVGSETYLRDSRDGKLYPVKKMQISNGGEYGACWMLQDLRFGSQTESYILTPEDSDVTEEVEIPAIPYYTYDSNTFSTSFMMDGDEYEDPNGTPLGYLYNYNLITAGYHSAHRSDSGNQVAATSICPKNWTLPRHPNYSYSNSEKQVTDNIEPYSNTDYYYYSSNTDGKYRNVTDQFLKVKSFARRYYNNGRYSDYTYRATKDFSGNYAYVTQQYSYQISLSSSSMYTPENAFMMRCMIPVDYQVVSTTINLNASYPTPYSTSYTQRVYAKTTDPEFVVVLASQNIRKRPGYQLIGWSEISGATVPDYYEGDIFELPISTSSITLYAVWKRNDNVNVTTFDDAFAAADKTRHNGYYAMQDIDADICDAVSEGQNGRLIDLRDNKVYWVTRFTGIHDTAHEGECWMTQNLDFELSPDENGTTLTPELSDTENPVVTRVDKYYSDAMYYGYMKASGYYFPDGGLTYSGDGTQYEQYRALASTSELSADDERWHYALGSYYSWSAATAITDISTITYNNYYRREPESSICPKGWKIPQAPFYANANSTIYARSFNTLSYFLLPNMNLGYNNVFFVDPFYPVADGWMTPTSDTDDFYTIINLHRMQNFGYYAAYWTNTVSSERNPYYWYFYTQSGDETKEDLKYRYSSNYGNSSNYNFFLLNIRCVAR